MATPKTPFQIREYAGHTTKFSIENIVSYDKRDRAVLPETGYFAKYGLELAPSMGDSSFVRSEIFLQVCRELYAFLFWFRALQDCRLVLL